MPESPHQANEARTYLIVDPDHEAGAALTRRIATLGAGEAAVATSGSSARELLAHSPVDVVLLASAACEPGQLGRLSSELGLLANAPVIVMTDDEGSGAARSLDATGALAPLARPFTDRELTSTIELALCRHDVGKTSRMLEDRFFSLSVDMLCFLDFNGYFKRLNPAWERTLGFTVDELMSRPFIEFVHPDDRERTLNQNREVRHGGRALGFENRYLCKDGSYRWFLWNAAPDTADRVIYSVARDITAKKELDDERDRLVRELTAAMAEVKALQDILPICSYCKKVRDDENYWQTVESYFSRHTNTRFSHGICPSCMQTEVEPQLCRLDKA